MTFVELFLRRTGRTPTPEEIREGLWFEDATKHGVDPMTLLYVADVAHADERKKAANEMRVAASEAAATIRAGLPTNPEWDKAAAWAAWFAKTMNTEAAWMTKWAIGSTIVIAAIVLAAVIISWRGGYTAGWNDARYQNYFSAMKIACGMLNESRHNIAVHHAEAHALRATMTKYGCQ